MGGREGRGEMCTRWQKGGASSVLEFDENKIVIEKIFQNIKVELIIIS